MGLLTSTAADDSIAKIRHRHRNENGQCVECSRRASYGGVRFPCATYLDTLSPEEVTAVKAAAERDAVIESFISEYREEGHERDEGLDQAARAERRQCEVVERLVALLDGDAGQAAELLGLPVETVRRMAKIETDAELHARRAHPDWEYATTEGPRKAWDRADEPPEGDGWERNTNAGRNGWERFDYTEESYWRRPKRGDDV